jgi:histidyl-tRNA synthetase
MEFSSLPGFREFFPDELAMRNHIFDAWRQVAARYGFVEYDGPPLEPLELYTRKSGEEIVGQLYRFMDMGGREVALRPEMTPSFARMIASRASALPKPIRWFSIPQLFRYERPQRGRLREHFQLNMDIVGETDPLADAELVAAGLDALRALGLRAEHIVARISDRRLISGVLTALGVPDEGRLTVFAALDKLHRESDEWVRDRLREAGAGATASDRILGLADATLETLSVEYGKTEEVATAIKRLERFFGHMRAFGLEKYVVFDAGLVRGLAYYTGTVFEIWERSGKLRAICGGGRYDDLLSALGGVDLPAVGFGMGDVVLAELLRDLELLPDIAPPVQDYIVCVSEAERHLALELAMVLRESGRRVTYDLRERGVGRQLKAASQAGAERAIILGPEELTRGAVIVRLLESGKESEVPIDSLRTSEMGAT